MAAKRGATVKKGGGEFDWSKIEARRTGDDTITLTFPGPITEMVAPIEKKGGVIPIEYVAVALTLGVAAARSPPKQRERIRQRPLAPFW